MEIFWCAREGLKSHEANDHSYALPRASMIIKEFPRAMYMRARAYECVHSEPHIDDKSSFSMHLGKRVASNTLSGFLVLI